MTEHQNGDKVKDTSNPDWERPHARAVVTDTNPENGDIEIMPLEQAEKGEKVTRDLEEVKELKQKTWLCLIGRSYGTSKSKETALKNCLLNYQADPDQDEPVTAWMAEVDQNHWELRGMGNVYSTFIDNQEEIEIDPELAYEINQREEDTTSLVQSALDEVEPYREGHNYRVQAR